MSSGDLTEFIRGRIAERGTLRDAKFMRDGFDAWAESEAPARVGQMEKIPAEHKMEDYGGAMTVGAAKRMHKMHMMCGGAEVNIAGFNINIDDRIINAVKEAKKLYEFIKTVADRLPKIEEDINDNILMQPDDYSQQIRDDAKAFIGYVQSLKGYISVLQTVLKYVQYIPTGAGRRNKKGYTTVSFRGGAATTMETITKWINYVKEKIMKIASYVDWFAKKAVSLKAILSLDSMQPEGQQILDALKPLYDLIGMVGYGGRKNSRRSYSPGCDRCRCGGKSLLSQINEQDLFNTGKKTVTGMLGETYRVPSGKARNKLPVLDITAMQTANQGRKGRAAAYNIDYSPGKQIGYSDEGTAAQMYESINMGPSQGTAPMRPSQGFQHSGFQQMKGPMKKTGYDRVKGVGKPSARGEIVKRVMREHGLSLPQASKYVKEHGLY